MDLIAVAVAKRFAEETLSGAGALKGAPCTIQSITPVEDGMNVVFSWVDNSGNEQTDTMFVANGNDGYSPTVKVEQTDDGAVITVEDNEGMTTAVVKNGRDGANGLPGENSCTGGAGYRQHLLNDVPVLHDLPKANEDITPKTRFFTDECKIDDPIVEPAVVDGIINGKLTHVLGYNSYRVEVGKETNPIDYYLRPDNNKNSDKGGSMTLRFGFDGDKFELIMQNYATIRMYVDEGDGYVFRYGGLIMKSEYARNNRACALFDFGSAQQRNIMIALGSGDRFGGFVHNKLYSIYPSSDVKPLAMYIGSSLTAGGAYQYTCWNYIVSQRLGLDWINCGEGATGFANDAGGLEGKKRVGDRLITDVFPKKPWLLTLEGSYNDMGGGLTVTKYVNEILRPTFESVINNIPECLSIVVGTIATCRDLKKTGHDWDEKNEALRQVALEYRLPFIDTLNGKVYDSFGNEIMSSKPWFTGSGYATNEQGDGNSDIYIKSDATHFNEDGDRYVAARMLESIMAIIHAERKTGRELVDVSVFNMTKSNVIIEEGGNEDISFFPSTATPIITSSNTTVVTVSNGVLYGVAPGFALITAEYNGRTDTCVVNVVPNSTVDTAVLVDIAATKQKTDYKVNDVVEVSDVVVTASYDDNTSRIVTGWSTNIDSIDTSTIGDKTLIITYEENGVVKTCNIVVTVSNDANESDSPTGIEQHILTNTSISTAYELQASNKETVKTYYYEVIGGETYYITTTNPGAYLRIGYHDSIPEYDLTSATKGPLTGGLVLYKALDNYEMLIPEGMNYLFIHANDETFTVSLTK